MSPQGNPPFRRRVGECSESDLGCPPVETWYLEWDVNTQPFPDLADSWLFTAGGSGGPHRWGGRGRRETAEEFNTHTTHRTPPRVGIFADQLRVISVIAMGIIYLG